MYFNQLLRWKISFNSGILIIIICLAISCKNNKNEMISIKLDEILTINQFSDSTFFSDIRSMYYHEEKYYISDYNRSQIFILDNNFKLIKTIGRKGEGPGELNGSAQLYVNSDTITVMNEGKSSFEKYTSIQKHISTVIYPNFISSNSERFFEYNRCLYFGISTAENTICKYNYSANRLEMFGKSRKYHTEMETRIKNHRHLSKYGKFIISVPDCQPIIEQYDFEGKLINIFDFSTIKPVSRTLEFIRESKQIENSYFVLNSDIYIYKNSLFVLITNQENEKNVNNNKIIEFKILDDKIVPNRILHLGNGWFNTFCVSEHGIGTFNATSGNLILYRYETN